MKNMTFWSPRWNDEDHFQEPFLPTDTPPGRRNPQHSSSQGGVFDILFTARFCTLQVYAQMSPTGAPGRRPVAPRPLRLLPPHPGHRRHPSWFELLAPVVKHIPFRAIICHEVQLEFIFFGGNFLNYWLTLAVAVGGRLRLPGAPSGWTSRRGPSSCSSPAHGAPPWAPPPPAPPPPFF